MGELDSPPTMEEFVKVIDNLPTGKVPGRDGISTEVIKCSEMSSFSNYTRFCVSVGRKDSFPKI